MNKQEFMDALTKGLSFLSPKELGDVVAEFEEHFEVGVERGHSEQQLVDQLGDPRRIIEAYRTEAIEKGGLRIDMETPKAPNVEPNADRREERHEDRSEERHEDRSEDREPRRERGTGFSSLVHIHDRHSAPDVREITVDTADSDIIFSLADADEVRVDIEGMSSYGVTAKLRGGVLTIRQETGIFRLLNWRKEPEIRVTLPRVFGGSVRIATAAGAIRLAGFKGSALSIRSVSGDMVLGDLYADGRIDITSTSGDIAVGKCMAESIALHLTSADVRFDMLTTLDLSITAVSGDIRQNKGAILEAKKLYIKTVSGDIKLALNDHWQRLDFQTVSGDVKLTLPIESAPFEVRMTTLSGEVKNPFGNVSSAGRTISVKSVSGDLRLKQG